jgi:hypothetical protein
MAAVKRLETNDDTVSVYDLVYDNQNPPQVIGEAETIYGKYSSGIRAKVRTDSSTGYTFIIIFALIGQQYEGVLRATDDPNSTDYDTQIGGYSGANQQIGKAANYCRSELFSATVTITP